MAGIPLLAGVDPGAHRTLLMDTAQASPLCSAVFKPFAGAGRAAWALMGPPAFALCAVPDRVGKPGGGCGKARIGHDRADRADNHHSGDRRLRSMCSTDIAPNCLQAAETAATRFIQNQSANTQIGIVAFGGFAEEVQPPTNDTEALQSAIESSACRAQNCNWEWNSEIAGCHRQSDKNVAPSITDASPGIPPTPVAKGAYVPDIIVLLTDGVSNTGPLPLDAAQQASDRGVRVYTIGFGTDGGSSFPNCEPQFQSAEPFGSGGGQFGGGGFGGGGGGFRRGIDEDTLRQVSDLTGGKYYAASSAGELESVFKQLPTYLIVKHKTTEISAFFAVIGAILALVAVSLSLIWHPLP